MQWGRVTGMAATPRSTRRPSWHSIEHVSGYNGGRVDDALGWILAELDLGPNTKFEAHSMLYKIYLGFMTISVLD
jgi:hypothetical protein